MPQTDEFRKTGNWLFRWRSFLPLFTVVLFLLPLKHFSYPLASHKLDLIWELFCFAVALLGLGLRAYTVAYVPQRTSGRNTKRQKADVLNTTGMYSIVRHPLYLGNFLIWLGLSLFAQSILFSLLCITIFFLYYERIIFAEEDFLRQKFGRSFLNWAAKTPKIVPDIRNWRRSDRPLSLRTILKREYSTLFFTVAIFTALEVVGDFFYLGRLQIDPVWAAIFLIALIAYLILMTLKKRKLLTDERQ